MPSSACKKKHNRLYLFVQLFDGLILVERNVDGSTALDVKAEVPCASLFLMHAHHAGRNGKQQNAGDREEDLSLFHKWKALALFLGSVVFRILQSHTVQAVDQQSTNNHDADHGQNNTKSSVKANPRTLPLASPYRTAAPIRVVQFPAVRGATPCLNPSHIAA